MAALAPLRYPVVVGIIAFGLLNPDPAYGPTFETVPEDRPSVLERAGETGLAVAIGAVGIKVGQGGPVASSSSSYVYQLVDQSGEAVYYGITNNPAVRLGAHARLPKGPFSGMQVISVAVPLPQAQALETSLIQQAQAEGRFIYNVAESSVPGIAPRIAVPRTVTPLETLLNPKLYPR